MNVWSVMYWGPSWLPFALAEGILVRQMPNMQFFYFLGDKSLLVLSADCRRIHTLYVEPKWLATMIMISINQTISIESRKIYNSLRNKNIFYQKKKKRIFYHVKFSNKMIIYRSHNAVPSIRWTVLRWILSYESAGFKKMAL